MGCTLRIDASMATLEQLVRIDRTPLLGVYYGFRFRL
jgi:hypothetical protein